MSLETAQEAYCAIVRALVVGNQMNWVSMRCSVW